MRAVIPQKPENGSMLEYALYYAKFGWHVFPCKRDKTPYTDNGVLSASVMDQQIEAWWKKWPNANIGVDLGRSGFMVLDLDPGHDMAQLEAKIGKLHPTPLSQDTPRGGKHLFYELAEGEIVPPSASKIAPHVDVRSFHSYVLVEPSVTDDGAYIMHGTPSRAAHRSDGMVEAAKQAKQRDANHDTWLIEPDLPENIERATKWLKEEAKIATQGMGGDHVAYSTAAMCKSFGLAPETALDLMWEHWSPRCDPPWAGEDDWTHLETKVKNAYEYNTSAPGNMTPAYREAVRAQKFKPVGRTLSNSETVGGMEFTAGRFRVVDREGIEHIKPPEWVVEGLLQKESYAMLFGAPGTFKTFVALDIALAIAAEQDTDGSSIWSSKIKVRGPVLFLAGEGRSGISRRIQAWEKTHTWGARVSRFVLGDPVPLVGEEITPLLNAAKSLHESYALVIIDTAGRALQGVDENAQKEVSKLTAMAETFRRELGASVLAIHHTGHGNTDREQGSNIFMRDTDTRLRLERVEKEFAVTLHVMKQKEADEGPSTKIELHKVPTSLGGDSLVCVKPESTRAASAHKPAEEKSKNDPTRNEDGLIFDKLDAAIKEEMLAVPGAIWTQTELAETLAKREDLQIGVRRIHELLKLLRVKYGTFASSVYHPKEKPTHRWQMKSRPM